MIPASMGNGLLLAILIIGFCQPGGFVHALARGSRGTRNNIGCRAAVTNGSRRDNLGVPAVWRDTQPVAGGFTSPSGWEPTAGSNPARHPVER